MSDNKTIMSIIIASIVVTIITTSLILICIILTLVIGKQTKIEMVTIMRRIIGRIKSIKKIKISIINLLIVVI